MKRLILVRYGQYESGHLTAEGISTMEKAASRFGSIATGTNRLLAANTPRAVESAAVLAPVLETQVEPLDELYAAEEDGRLPDSAHAWQLLQSLGEDCDTLVAVVSREYIEDLPSLILDQKVQISLDRGQCLVIDLNAKTISYLRD